MSCYKTTLKTASVNAKSFDNLVDLLKDVSVKSNKKLSWGSPTDAARKIMYNGESGSMIIDGLLKADSAIAKKRVSSKFFGNLEKKYTKLQDKLSDLDIKTGNKIVEKLEKNKITKKAKGAFIYDHNVPLEKSVDGSANEILEIGVPKASAPIEKTKKAVLPFVGAMYLSNKIIGESDHDKKEQGGEKVANLREQLTEKIISSLDDSSVEKVASSSLQSKSDGDLKILLSKASKMLKIAAENEKKNKDIMEKLANENKVLYNEVIEKKKIDRSLKLATEMNCKGMIKKADIDIKAKELIDLDDNAFSIIKTAIESVPNSLSEEKNGLDNLTFLDKDNNIGVRRTLASSLDEASQ